jgi:hypothetical protein
MNIRSDLPDLPASSPFRPINSQAQHEIYGRELATLLERVLAGELVTDRVVVERRVVRALGALVRLQQRHTVDEQGRCSICRTAPRGWRRWPQRATCTVNSALSFYLSQPERFVLSVITENTTVGGRS